MTTNYYNTLITIADDSPTTHSIVPDLSKSSVAAEQFQWITDQPYQLTSDDVIFARVAKKQEISDAERASEREAYFQTGRACLRTSPLAKKYGWGIHHDLEGRVALFAVESEEYATLMADDSVTKVKAMRSSRG